MSVWVVPLVNPFAQFSRKIWALAAAEGVAVVGQGPSVVDEVVEEVVEEAVVHQEGEELAGAVKDSAVLPVVAAVVVVGGKQLPSAMQRRFQCLETRKRRMTSTFAVNTCLQCSRVVCNSFVCCWEVGCSMCTRAGVELTALHPPTTSTACGNADEEVPHGTHTFQASGFTCTDHWSLFGSMVSLPSDSPPTLSLSLSHSHTTTHITDRTMHRVRSDAGEGTAGGGFHINAKYAARLEHNKNRDEKQRLEEKYDPSAPLSFSFSFSSPFSSPHTRQSFLSGKIVADGATV
jgi:hypothetical protein